MTAPSAPEGGTRFVGTPDPIVEHLRSAGLAFASGGAATVAFLLSPLGQAVGPIELPTIPLDLRLVLLPSIFVFLHVTLGAARWPLPALVLPGLALLVAAMNHLQASALVDFLTAFRFAEQGERIDLVAVLASGASLLIALAASMDRAQVKVGRLARKAGAPAEAIAELRAAGQVQAARTLGFTAAAFVALTLLARLGDGAFGGERAPLPELLGAVVAVGVAALLFPGVWGSLARRATAPLPPP